MIDSRWSNAQHAGQSATPTCRAFNNENALANTSKKGGNVVVQSVSLLSSPRQPSSQANNTQDSPSASDHAEKSGPRGNIADNSDYEEEIESPKISVKTCLTASTEPCNADTNPTGIDLPDPTMSPARKNAVDDEDRLHLLAQAQQTGLQRINVDNVPKRRKAKLETVRLEDLYLARRIVDLSNPAASARTWIEDPTPAHDNPVKSNDHGEQDAPQASLTSQPVQSTEQPDNTLDQANDRASRWPSKADMKAEKAVIDENAWGSDASDDTRASNIPDASYGKLLHKETADGAGDTMPINWNGEFLPPPDEHDRLRYNNNNQTYKKKFDLWLDGIRLSKTSSPSRTQYFSNGILKKVIPVDALDDIRNCPDGISMVDRQFTINFKNADGYGYDFSDPEEKAQLFEPVHIEFRKETENPAFAKFKHETTEILVANWLKHRKNARQLSVDVGLQTMATPPQTKAPIDDRFVPELNIYLRPATEADLEELVRIYNLHIEHGIAPTETYPISEQDMASRMHASVNGHLPFIVAAKMNQKGARVKEPGDHEAYSRRHGLPVSHQEPQRLSCVEILAGFACAQDLTAADYVERTSAEVEIYVDPVHRKKGVGKCLLDKLLQICDRGHRLITNCDFHCAPDLRHLYDSGGLRELHKLYILCRKWHVPKPVKIQVEGARRHRKLPMRPTNGDDFNVWLKDWLESCNFEIEGILRKVGAKDGR